MEDLLSIDNFCASSVMQCNSNGYSVVIRNAGSSSIAQGTFSLYFDDVSRGTTSDVSCQVTSPINPGSTFVCPSGSGNALPLALSASSGDVILLRLVGPDGSAATSSTKIGSPLTVLCPNHTDKFTGLADARRFPAADYR